MADTGNKNNSKAKSKSKNLHAGHRERVRKRFIKEGSFDNFEYHQILELILFYSLKQQDTNELAHKMLNEYGSFHALMDAKPEDIMKRCKVSEVTAVLISMFPPIIKKYLQSKWTRNEIIDSPKLAYKYFKSLLIGRGTESFYMLCLDTNKRLIRDINISDGNVRQSYVYVDTLVEHALLYQASFVIIGHNHPAGTGKPSAPDVEATNSVKTALETVGIVLIDHIIVYDDKYFSFAEKELCSLKYF